MQCSEFSLSTKKFDFASSATNVRSRTQPSQCYSTVQFHSHLVSSFKLSTTWFSLPALMNAASKSYHTVVPVKDKARV